MSELRDRIDAILKTEIKDLTIRDSISDLIVEFMHKEINKRVAIEIEQYKKISPEDEQAMDIIRRAAKAIENNP